MYVIYIIYLIVDNSIWHKKPLANAQLSESFCKNTNAKTAKTESAIVPFDRWQFVLHQQLYETCKKT